MAAGKLQAEVCGSIVGIAPLHFAHGHHLALAVEGILLVVAALEEIHIGLVVVRAGDVAIVYLELSAIHPVGRLLRKVLNSSAYALGIDIALGILPTLLQQQDERRMIVACDRFNRTEARLTDSTRLARKLYLIVELHSRRTCRERYAVIEIAHGIARTGDRLHHVAKINRPGSQHMHVDQPQHLNAHDMRGHAGTIAAAALLAIDGDVALRHACHLSHDIAVGPWRATLIDVRHRAVPRARRTYFVKGASGAADNFAFLDVACYPLVKIGVLELKMLSTETEDAC